jgi:hypothetical protein
MNDDEETRETAGNWLDIVRQQVGGIRYGIVQVVVHEGHVVQIERTEKVRLAAKSSRPQETSASAHAEG